MFLYPRSKDRPFHLGRFPLETLPRDDGVADRESRLPPRRAAAFDPADDTLSRAAHKYREIFAQFVDGQPARAKAPVPDDLDRRTVDIKGSAYFLDASAVGICRIPANAWLEGTGRPAHGFAIVAMVEHPRLPEIGNLAHDWTRPAVDATMAMRTAEIAACLAEHIRHMGFAARAHIAGNTLVDAERLAVLAGIAVRRGATIENPYFGDKFALAVVSTDYEMAPDRPLRADALNARGLAYWWGVNGAQSGRERNRRARRATHLSAYPMEQVKRIDRPTTLILDDEVPRVPKRAAFFQRALHGDLGDKAKKERTRFSFKTPFSFGLLQLIRAMVRFQDGAVAAAGPGGPGDPEANARAIKSLSYFLGADLTGICEIPRYAWFSHKEDGTAIAPYHRYAVVMLIDQGYETMEGSSGDDWISGAQSMRAYLRGAEIAGVMAEFLRARGFPARPQTNADSDVLQIPLILWAGLGELSRIGELVLNPFVGPRFKSVVLTTDMPLAIDKPIDFGLQTFCNLCLKCARECPCDAIPFGDKTMFNGYEIWKPDVERCTRYRVTNPKGSACGRCMKTCPINKVVDADGALLTRIGSWLGINAMWLKPPLGPVAARIDDWLGNGRLNPAKKWWLDHEIVDGVAVAPRGVNRRDLDPGRKIDPAAQKMAYYHASMMPPPDDPGPMPVDRKAAMAAAQLLETPDEARRRAASGGPVPAHYIPTPPAGTKPGAAPAAASPYK
ncbi:MAG: Fe-S protein [Rhodospirillales bacterium]|nr:Fe-S protein [Rhodospirillales bacterium]